MRRVDPVGVHECARPQDRCAFGRVPLLVAPGRSLWLDGWHGVYGVEELSWYRLVGLTFKPVYSIPRRGMEVSAPIAHSADGSVVEVRLAYGDHRYEVAVERLTYNGLVSWVESGPPRLV